MTLAPLEQARAHQVAAADPGLSAFVTANAGSGKTTTLVDRVARLLLAGVAARRRSSASPTPRPPPPRCSAGCSTQLGDWAVMADDRACATSWPSWTAATPRALTDADLSEARAPVRPRAGDAGRAEDPDHPRLLRKAAAALPAGGRRLARLHGDGRRRPPSPSSHGAREDLARARPGRRRRPGRPRPTPISRSSWTADASTAMFGQFEAERGELAAYVDALRRRRGAGADVWRAAASTPTDARRHRGRRPSAGLDRRRLARAPPTRWRPGGDQRPEARPPACATPSRADAGLRRRWRRLLHRQAARPRDKPGRQDGAGLKRREPALARSSRRDYLARAATRMRAARVADDTRRRPDPGRAPTPRSTRRPRRARGALDFADLIGKHASSC